MGKVAEEEEQMYPQRTRMVRQALRLGLVVTLVILALSACESDAAKDSAEEAATMKTVAGDGREQLGDGGPATEAGLCGPRVCYELYLKQPRNAGNRDREGTKPTVESAFLCDFCPSS